VELRGPIAISQPMPASRYRRSIEHCFGSHVPTRAFFGPNPAKYPVSVVSQYAVAQPELRMVPAVVSVNTRIIKGRPF
jgi:hypothetical protein